MKTLIWTLPTRIFHWLLAIGFIATCIFSESDENMNFHYAFGLFVGALLLFRIIFGFFGPKYSHFRDFQVGIKKQKEFFSGFFTKTKTYAGHNPAAALAMLGIFVLGFLCSLSGYLLYGAESNTFNIGIDKEILEKTHKLFIALVTILVVFHFAGIILDLIFHRKTGTFLSIFTGYKNVETENIRLSGAQKVFSILWLIVPLILFFLAIGLPVSESDDDDEQNTEQTEVHDDDD